MTTRSITLFNTEASSVGYRGIDCRQVIFTVINPVNITNKLFVVQNVLVDGVAVVEFRTFATAADLDNLTEDTPPDEEPLRPYRVDSVTLTTDEPKMIDDFIETARRRFTDLLQTLKRLDITTTTTFTLTY